MRPLPLALVLLALTVGLAGCASDDGTVQPTQANNSTGPTLEDPNVTFDGTDVYAYESETVDEVRWENGSFPPATCFACPNSETRIDVTPLLASNAPNLVTAQVENDGRVFDAVAVDLETEGAQVYEANDSFQQVSGVLAPTGGTVEIVVENLAPDARASVDYSLRIQIQSNRTVLPTDVPVELPEPEDPPGLVVEPVDLEGPARLMLWDGEDVFLGHRAIDGRTTINVSEASGGPLVAYLTGTDGIAAAAPVNASATDTTMRPLALAGNEKAASVSSGNVTVDPRIDRVPLQVGLFLRGSNQVGTQYSGHLQGPNGTLVSVGSQGYITGPDGEFRFPGDPGDPGLVAGDYTASFEFSQTTGGEAGAAWWTYQR